MQSLIFAVKGLGDEAGLIKIIVAKLPDMLRADPDLNMLFADANPALVRRGYAALISGAFAAGGGLSESQIDASFFAQHINEHKNPFQNI